MSLLLGANSDLKTNIILCVIAEGKYSFLCKNVKLETTVCSGWYSILSSQIDANDSHLIIRHRSPLQILRVFN